MLSFLLGSHFSDVHTHFVVSLDHSECLCMQSYLGPSFFVLMCSDCLRLSFVLVSRYTDRVFRSLTLYPLSSGLFAIIAFFYNLFHVYLPFLSVLHTCFVSLSTICAFCVSCLFLMDMMHSDVCIPI